MKNDFISRLISAFFVAGLMLFAGYMCGSPIIRPDFNNFMPYMFAIVFGGVAFIRPWRFGP